MHASGYTIPVKCQGGNAKSYRILATEFTVYIQLKRNRIMRLRGSFCRYIGIQGNLKQPRAYPLVNIGGVGATAQHE